MCAQNPFEAVEPGSDCRIPGPGVGVFEEREILQWTLLLFNVCKSLGGYSAI